MLLGLLLCVSCATTTLWEHTHPRERVWVDAASISEEELVARSLRFEPYQDKWCKGYLVEKSSLRKLSDYTLRTLGTPITLAIDTPVVIVAVVGSSPAAMELLVQILEAATR